MIGWLLISWAWATAPTSELNVLSQSMRAELNRALTELQLPDQPKPYLVSVEVIDGDVVTSTAQFGAITSHDHGPYRNARVEVRVGDYQFDSSNFTASLGVPDGVVSRPLPDEDIDVAVRRELWLALDQAYKGATQQLAAKRAARTARQREYLDDLSPIDPVDQPPASVPDVDGEHMRALVGALSGALVQYPSLEDAGAIGRDWQGQRVIQSSENISAWLRTGHAVVRVAAAARAEDGAIVRDARWWVARTASDLPDQTVMIREVEEMAAWVMTARNAEVEDDYMGPVLFEEPAAIELFRQLLQPQVCGTPPPETAPDPYMDDASSAPHTRLGRRLLPGGWTVIDDARAWPDAAGGYTHDFEGVPPQRVTLVDDGVVRQLLMSRVPRKGIERSTGHGRSLGNARREAMPTAIQITPARTRSAKALRRAALSMARQAGLPYVLVIRRLIPPAMSDEFQVAFTGEGPLPGLTTPIEAYRLYPDGRQQVVRNLGFVGVDRRALRDIAAAGKPGIPVDVMDSPGRTGRFSIGAAGGLPATWSAPSILISELELRGRAGGESRAVPAPPMPTPSSNTSPPAASTVQEDVVTP